MDRSCLPPPHATFFCRVSAVLPREKELARFRCEPYSPLLPEQQRGAGMPPTASLSMQPQPGQAPPGQHTPQQAPQPPKLSLLYPCNCVTWERPHLQDNQFLGTRTRGLPVVVRSALRAVGQVASPGPRQPCSCFPNPPSFVS